MDAEEKNLPLAGDATLEEFRRQWKQELLHSSSSSSSLNRIEKLLEEEEEQDIQEGGDKHVAGGGAATRGVGSPTTTSTTTAVSPHSFPSRIPLAPQQNSTATMIAPQLQAPEDHHHLLEDSLSALYLYERATQHERTGNLNQAMKDYRRAIKMDPLVEQEYRNQVYSVSSNDTNPQHHPPQPQQQLHDQDQRSNYYTYYNFPEDFDHLESIRSNLKALDEKALQFQKQPHNNIINTTALSMFSKLPDEIILGFFKWSVLFDHSLIQTLSSVCKRFFILTRERSLYRFLTAKLHNGHSHTFASLSEEVNYLYSGDWLDAFLEKPRLRINGVYISRLNYLRTGYGESYNQPIHVVSYFRYIRFFNDGKVLLLTSTTEPSMVVKSLTPALKMSGLMKGTFEWAGHQAHLTLKDPERPGCVFYCTLSVAHTKRAKNLKLEWVVYSVHTPKTTSEVPLQTLRPFIFSKVKSY